MTIRLARCAFCKRWVRVLPLEALPHKTYGIGVIQAAIANYVNTPHSYRTSARRIVVRNGQSPAHTSPYRWITGLGEKVLDRSPALRRDYPPPASAAIAQTQQLRPELRINDIFLHAPVAISPAKYRSERRHDQLTAVARLLRALVPGTPTGSLQMWNLLLLPTFFVAVWDFPCRLRKTAMQRVDST